MLNNRLPKISRALVMAAFCVLGWVVPAAAGTVTGVVRNGTSGKPAAGVDVFLIQLQGGMEIVASTKSDAQGNYKLDNAAVGSQQAMLIRAVYRGVMFHQPLMPGSTTADVTIYEPSSDAKKVQVGPRAIILQPNGSMLLVEEQYELQNQSQPPMAYFNQQGDFNFEIPEGAELSQVSSVGPSGMPLVQGTLNRGDRRYAIAYAFQPGESSVRLSYQLPYPSNQTKLHFTSEYAVQRVLVAAPPTVQVAGEGFSPAGTEQGLSLYTRDGVTAGLAFDVSVSGTAPPPAAGDQSQGADQGQAQGQDQADGHISSPAIQALPNRLDSLKWILIAGFAAMFALGIVFVWRRPVALVAEGVAGVAPPVMPSAPRAARKGREIVRAPEAAKPLASVITTPVANPVANAVATSEAQAISAVDREVDRSLDALKDRLFRLELRHQAGTISEEDYARERSRTEQILRELVRG